MFFRCQRVRLTTKFGRRCSTKRFHISHPTFPTPNWPGEMWSCDVKTLQNMLQMIIIIIIIMFRLIWWALNNNSNVWGMYGTYLICSYCFKLAPQQGQLLPKYIPESLNYVTFRIIRLFWSHFWIQGRNSVNNLDLSISPPLPTFLGVLLPDSKWAPCLKVGSF